MREDRPSVPCPHCGQLSTPIPQVTVASLVVDEAQSSVVDSPYWLCTGFNCPVAYFTSADAEVLTTDRLRTPLHFKRDAHKRYACYCNKVTEEEVRQMVREKGLDRMQPIIRTLRGEAQSDCRHRNP